MVEYGWWWLIMVNNGELWSMMAVTSWLVERNQGPKEMMQLTILGFGLREQRQCAYGPVKCLFSHDSSREAIQLYRKLSKHMCAFLLRKLGAPAGLTGIEAKTKSNFFKQTQNGIGNQSGEMASTWRNKKTNWGKNLGGGISLLLTMTYFKIIVNH